MSSFQGNMDTVVAQLTELGREAPKIVRKSLSAPMRAVQKAAQQAAGAATRFKDTHGNIAASIGRKVYTKQGFIAAAKVGIGVGMKNPRWREKAGHGWKYNRAESIGDFFGRTSGKRSVAFQAHLLSLGTAQRYTGHRSRSGRDKQGKYITKGKTKSPVMYRGFITPDQYFRAAISGTESTVTTLFAASLTEQVRKVVP